MMLRSASRTEAPNDDEYWIGIDWGTTNCAVAIYSRPLGRTKWMRLGPGCAVTGSHPWNDAYLLTERQKNRKIGRIMPSVLVFAAATNLNIFKDEKHSSHEVKLLQLNNGGSRAYFPWYNVSDLLPGSQKRSQLWVCVGASAERFISSMMSVEYLPDANQESKVFSATIRSVKRIILKELAAKTRTSTSSESVFDNKNGSAKPISVSVLPLGSDETIQLDAVTVTAIFLRAIRFASRNYLSQPKLRRKLFLSPYSLQDTGLSRQHCCLGVPATASLAYRSLLQDAAHRAGFLSSTCITESTAAAIAYGLFTRDGMVLTRPAENEALPKQKQTIIVFDMGGGTTDITIAEREISTRVNNSSDIPIDDGKDMEFHVCVTVGNDQLGGDDMDQALLGVVKTKLIQQSIPEDTVNANQLLMQCREAKLLLCDTEDDRFAASASVNVRGVASIIISQEEFEIAMQPILVATRALIQSALKRYQLKQGGPDNTEIDEVILIGGASRVPAIRALLKDIFVDRPNGTKGGISELCTSVNAMSAVAQGCAVSAALVSGTVPFHELKSSYMLDTIPYSIGILLNARANDSSSLHNDSHSHSNIEHSPASSFVEILPQGASLPAAGCSTFVLADVRQAGISLTAVEHIGETSSNDEKQGGYNILGEFTFLLHRLSKDNLSALKIRSVEVGMTLKENGEFVVSIFDKNDPDHIRKKEWYQRAKETEKFDPATPNLDMNSKSSPSEAPLSWEQVLLLIACIALLILYVVVKITFSDKICGIDLENTSSVSYC